MEKINAVGEVFNDAAAIYFLGSVGIALAVLYGLAVQAAHLVPGISWQIVSALFSLNVCVVIYRSFRAKALTGYKGLILTAVGLLIMLMYVGTVNEMMDIAQSQRWNKGPRGAGADVDVEWARMLQGFTTLFPCLLAFLGLSHALIEPSSADLKRQAAERRRWPNPL